MIANSRLIAPKKTIPILIEVFEVAEISQKKKKNLRK